MPKAQPPYTFTHAMPEGHFLTDWVRYCATRTDAAYEIHEAAGLTLLASATPRIRLPLRSGRIGTNLYTLVVAESTISRKTTSKDFAKNAHKAAFTEQTICPGLSSPEGFFEHLSEQPWSTFYSDELGELLRKMQSAKFMAGFGGHLLELYAGGDHFYRRSSKRTRDNKPVRDEIKVTDAHLSILGLTTPVTLEMLTRADIENGLLARFAIVMPDNKPDRMDYFAVEESQGLTSFNSLVLTLAKLRLWTTNGPTRDVRFAGGVFDCLEKVAIEIEDAARGASNTTRIMLHRLTPMAGKTAACLAAGWTRTPNEPTLTITSEDAEGAVTIMRRRKKDALTFAARVGENDFERYVASCARIVRERGSTPRRVVAQNCHVEKRVLDSIEATLLDRGHISVTDGGRIWSWNK